MINVIGIKIDGDLVDLTVEEDEWTDLLEGRAAFVEANGVSRWVQLAVIEGGRRVELTECDWSFNDDIVVVD